MICDTKLLVCEEPDSPVLSGGVIWNKFKKGINHPGGSDLIFYPKLVGLSNEPTVDEIVDLAMKGIFYTEVSGFR